VSTPRLDRVLRWTVLVAVLAPLLTASACRENAEEAEAEALRDKLGQSYLQWARVPGFEQRRASSTAHGKQVDVYWNDQAVRSAGARPFEAMAPGSTMVKEAYLDGRLKNLAVMEKRYDGWFWAEWEPAGDVLFSGRPGLCIDCHRRGDDYLRTISPSELP
jgi:hypothetical protein